MPTGTTNRHSDNMNVMRELDAHRPTPQPKLVHDANHFTFDVHVWLFTFHSCYISVSLIWILVFVCHNSMSWAEQNTFANWATQEPCLQKPVSHRIRLLLKIGDICQTDYYIKLRCRVCIRKYRSFLFVFIFLDQKISGAASCSTTTGYFHWSNVRFFFLAVHFVPLLFAGTFLCGFAMGKSNSTNARFFFFTFVVLYLLIYQLTWIALWE